MADVATVAGAFHEVVAGVTPFTVGVEEEYLLVDVEGPSLVDRADTVAARSGGDPRIRCELPPSQIEMATQPRSSMRQVEADLRSGRQAVADWCRGVARPIAAAVHPVEATFRAAGTERGRAIVDRYGILARGQLLGSLQVHVAVGSADRLFAVHDELRNHLPHLAAIAAAAPFHRGEDQELASIRPMLASMLPRQGVPPALRSCESFATELCWGAESGGLQDPTQWWWELRPHPAHGTLEVRVSDAQPDVTASMGVIELTVALVRWLAARADADDLPPPAETWRIEENRWSAAIHGLGGTFADVRSGRCQSAREVAWSLVEEVEAWAEDGLDRTRQLIDAPAHQRIRSWGIDHAVDGLVEVFTG